MKMPTPTDSDPDRFRSLVPGGPDVKVKPMFCQLAAFANGTVFAGLFGSAVGVKLSPEEAERRPSLRTSAERRGDGLVGEALELARLRTLAIEDGDLEVSGGDRAGWRRVLAQ